MVEIKNLTRFYGNIPAVKNLSFTVEDGEILGFLGPNGAGKSTTMNMITGYLPSSSGTVVVDGFDIAQQPEEVFLKLTAQNTGKKSLEEIFDEIGEDMDRNESEAAAERENKTPAEGEK